MIYTNTPILPERAEELLALGVNVPRSTTLMNALSAQGLYAGPTVRNVAGAAAALKEVLA